MAQFSKQRTKRIYNDVNQLKNIGPKSDASIKFILETTPFDDDEEDKLLGDEECFIVGRLLPNSDLYKKGSVRVMIKLEKTYPFRPPSIFVQQPIFHPNVDKNGKYCVLFG